MSKFNIGPYIDDIRLASHGETGASFFGDRCDPAVYVTETAFGFVARVPPREGDSYSMMSPAPTVEEALMHAIGPVQSAVPR